MAPDVEVANYQKTVKKVTDHWTKVIADAQSELKKVEADLKKLKQKPPTSKKEMDALKKSKDKKVVALATRLEAVKKKLTNAAASFKLNLEVLKPPPKMPENELIKLGKQILSIFKKNGVDLKQWLNLKIQVIDLKKRHVKFTLTFRF